MLGKLENRIEKSKNEIEFYCIHCQEDFFCDVGKINLETEDGVPEFEKAVICPKCDVRYNGKPDQFTDHFELTEIGQSQLTGLHLGEDFDLWDDECGDTCPICEFFGKYLLEMPYERESRKIGRNEYCPCGSGKKYKKCCLRNERAFHPDLKVSPEGR